MPDDLLALLADDLEPHPALVAAARPSPAQLREAIAYQGLFPDVPLFCPAVPAVLPSR